MVMIPIARRNLFHDKVKLTTALVGVVFSVLLVACLGGFYEGTAKNASGIIDNAGADLWVVARGTRTIDLCEPISERRLYQTLATPGVEWAERLLLQFSQWRMPDGRQEIAQVVGLEPNSRLNLPWAMAVGRRDSIRHDDGVIIDEGMRARFGTDDRALQIGDRAEVFNNRVRVSGFCSGVASFTTIPYVFTTHKQAEQCSPIGEGQTKFIAVKAETGTPIRELKQRLLERMPDVNVLTSEEFSQRSRDYWMFGTGLGMGIMFTALLGLIVGCVIVGQTIYASTLDRLGEYGTLKALGMSNRDLAKIILRQSLLIGLFGYAIGAVAMFFVGKQLPAMNLSFAMPPWLYAAMLIVTTLTCSVASITSVAKVFRLPPATVFRA
jgi:putative ABC transport system permease protein